MRIIVTGGAGFIGSNFVRHLLKARPDCRILNLDALTYAGNLENLAGVEDDPRYSFVHGDITRKDEIESCFQDPVDAVVNFAAESHVDRSIEDSGDFIRTNVSGTQVLLDAARKFGVTRYLQVSTDEVYGSIEEGLFHEASPIKPNSPYAASKAGADLLVRSYVKTHGLPAIVTRCSNNYGPYQFPEKLVPLMVLNALEGQPLPVYGDGLNTRDWIHVLDHCRALEMVLFEGRPGEVYNIGGNEERRNIDVVERILDILGKPRDLIEYVKDRPGHDRRYAIDSGHIQSSLGWSPGVSFESGLEETIRWYQENTEWVSHAGSGEYKEYYQRMYGDRDRMGSQPQPSAAGGGEKK